MKQLHWWAVVLRRLTQWIEEDGATHDRHVLAEIERQKRLAQRHKIDALDLPTSDEVPAAFRRAFEDI